MGASFPITSLPDMTGSLNSGGQLAQLGPATGEIGVAMSMILGMGLKTHVTLWEQGQVVRHEAAFPLCEGNTATKSL